ncbi:GNAT family N-acetyltransferase [Adhaeribacter radiodurans]|uniref:GNAT family N-acetyltransferase n=1 Tax=Adhaeribacter radiodurans TaxID=2745197 RepID=A0A7L7L821_9BACT|nr:GNAT family N-acetyltransferase [Adhaeribacter radiodurans]QMU28519.1 GNAT family N-acetyltransferase [Adhaeribacter radiodurans]
MHSFRHFSEAGLQIRLAEPADASILAELGRRTFLETFYEVVPQHAMLPYLAASFQKEKITAEIEEKKATYFLANLKVTPIGYAKIRDDRQPEVLKDNMAVELERIYVLQNYIGKGMGRQLYQFVENFSKNNDYAALWLSVWQNNTVALFFYEKLGFKPKQDYTFYVSGIPYQNLILSKDLTPTVKFYKNESKF